MSHSDNIFYRLLTSHERLRIVLFAFFAFCILAISLTFFALSIGKPYLGIRLVNNNQGWAVEIVDANGSASEAGIREGDRPVETNGQPAQVFLGKYEKAGVAFGRLMTKLAVVDDHGQLRSVALEDSSLS